MLTNKKVERVRGMSDVLPADYQFIKQIESQLWTCFHSFGYQPIDVPIVEYTELHLRKSGLDVVSRLYDFTYNNRHLCLRPEMTASVIRAYVNELQDVPLPIRLFYVGPVFRYEKPQRERYRQFTEMGVELIGTKHSAADAEVIYIACKGLDLLGLTQYQLTAGHIGILTKFLDKLGLERRLRNFLVANMENLRNKGPEFLFQRLREVYPNVKTENTSHGEFFQSLTPESALRKGKLNHLLQGMSLPEARETILELLFSMHINIEGSRSPEEIVDRLLTKLKREEQIPLLNQALSFMNELGQMVGPSSEVLPEAKKLATSYGVENTILDELEAVVKTLVMYDFHPSRLCLDLGLTRGLQYYTGTIFEIHHQITGEKMKICGGGRYDDLAATLGSQQNTPATGFAYGLERISNALAEENKDPKCYRPVDIFVIPVGSDDYPYAIHVSEQLRKSGISAEIDVRNRSVKSNLQYAHKRKIPFAVIVGSTERQNLTVTLRYMVSRVEEHIALTDLVTVIKKQTDKYE